ncbi:DKNYY domain-containing protein [Emticicia fontis]
MLKKLFPFSLLGFLFSNCSMNGLKNGYYIESDTVMFYSGFPATPYQVQGADASSFKAINKTYGKDKNQVFYRYRPIQKADPASFKVLEGFFSKDKNYVFSDGGSYPDYIVIISHDPDFFETVPNYDETSVNHTAEGILYGRDRQHVYKGPFVIELADPATFEYIPMRSGSGFNLARDKRYVYWREKPLDGADGSTFQKLSNDYFKDAKAIWSTKVDNRGNLSWVKLPDADMATFTIVNKESGIARDKNFHYSNGEPYTPKPTQ